MFVFARRIEHALDVSADHPHYANPRAQRWPALFCDQQQRFHRGLPFVGIVFGHGQLGDVRGDVTERDQRFPARRRDRIDKPLILRRIAFAPNW